MAPQLKITPDIEKNRQGGICHFLNLQEDNVRFILLAVLLYIYLAIGAFIFQAIEEAGETKMRKDFEILYNEFIHNLTHCYDIPMRSGETEDWSSRTFGFPLDDVTESSFDDGGFNGDDKSKMSTSGGSDSDFISSGNDNNNMMGAQLKAVSTLLLQSYSSVGPLSNSFSSGRGGSIINGTGNGGRESHGLNYYGESRLTRSDLSGGSGGGSSGSKDANVHLPLAQEGPFLVTLDGLHELLYAYGNATQAGVLWKRKRWDWVGSFHFAWTIVSTIGYGATTPATTLGKILIIPYGFIGCACGLLFFNLFLERIITFLATCMRTYRIQRQKRRPCIGNDVVGAAERGEASSSAVAATATKGNAGGESSSPPPPPPPPVVPGSALEVPSRRGHSPSRSSTGEESTVEQPDWKPSVYWVMLCLFVMSVAVICASGALFQHMEMWTFSESVYFSFVSYATIGFGDFVSLQGANYGRFEVLYRFVAYVLMVFGCCCIYSLLNVTSIVIKQFLNYIIKKMDYVGECCCCTYCRCSAAKVRRRLSTRRSRRGRQRGRIPPKLRHIKSCQAHTVGGRCTSDRCQIAVIKQSNAARALALGHHPYNCSDPYNYPGSPDGNSDAEYGPGGGGYDCGGFGGSRFDLDERRCSGENMISIRGELSNKVSLAVMQKRLYETAQMSRHSYDYPGSFSASSVGPLAIVTEKLGDNPA